MPNSEVAFMRNVGMSHRAWRNNALSKRVITKQNIIWPMPPDGALVLIKVAQLGANTGGGARHNEHCIVAVVT